MLPVEWDGADPQRHLVAGRQLGCPRVVHGGAPFGRQELVTRAESLIVTGAFRRNELPGQLIGIIQVRNRGYLMG